MVFSSDEFVHVWGADSLVQLPKQLATAPIPTDACEFLVRIGLPALIHHISGSTEGKITFCRLGTGLSPILSEETGGPALPSDWSVYWVLGDEFFCNGSAWWCIHQDTGQIDRIDIELDTPIDFV